MSLKKSTWQVQPTDLERYAWVSGDINPIHFDAFAALELGLPGTIVHGLFAHAKLMSALIEVSSGEGWGAIKNAHTKFAAMMPCPGTYEIEVARGNLEQTLVAKVLNAEGATCVEVTATYAPK